jgi:hypothetical protein
MIELAQCQQDLDSNLGRRIIEQLGEGGQRPRIADPAKRLDCRPSRFLVFKSRHQGVHRAWIVESAECFGRRDPYPPVAVLEQLDGG